MNAGLKKGTSFGNCIEKGIESHPVDTTSKVLMIIMRANTRSNESLFFRGIVEIERVLPLIPRGNGGL